MSNYKVLLFYKYVNLESPELIVQEHLNCCLHNDIKGRVFFANEGVNGTVSRTIENIEKYKTHLTSYTEFKDIWFEEDEADEHAFKKMHVRLKNEVVHGGLENVSIEHGGKQLSPEELHRFYSEGKEFVIIDARNWYESKIGKFKNALTPPMKNFREWKKVVDEDLKEYKDKTIITYCTGGIRCEKASAYMIESGFKYVYQLEGGMFVFDERRVVNPNSKEDLIHIAKCHFCGEPTSYYINYHNLACDKIIVCCHKCKVENDYCCSDECRKSTNKRKRYHLFPSLNSPIFNRC
ncbi:MAG: rhodanese-related sulfurtransferase [Ignavibacteriaceae bacterium]|nr:rhodanese-related sulfurtransferase [Ignavibacteriaceae bacterium]